MNFVLLNTDEEKVLAKIIQNENSLPLKSIAVYINSKPAYYLGAVDGVALQDCLEISKKLSDAKYINAKDDQRGVIASSTYAGKQYFEEKEKLLSAEKERANKQERKEADEANDRKKSLRIASRANWIAIGAGAIGIVGIVLSIIALCK